MEFLSYIMETKLILIPVLYIIGYIIKNTSLIKNKYIPVILLIIGIIISVLMGGDTIINNVIQGILVAGATVLANQMVTQSRRME